MVGGTVIGVSRKGGEALLNVKDRTYGDECAVRCEERRLDTGAAVVVEVGDAVWWQCGKVYWTPAAVAGTPLCDHDHHYSCTPRSMYDIPLTKIGYSH